jgi:hypothetical protein
VAVDNRHRGRRLRCFARTRCVDVICCKSAAVNRDCDPDVTSLENASVFSVSERCEAAVR